ncbi:MAG: alpha/beta fold hydrolase [Pseudomonadota bacterium]
MFLRSLLLALPPFLLSSLAQAYPPPEAGDFLIPDFAFEDGSRLDLRQHYRTLGTLRRGPDGRASNAVIVMHGTTGSGAGFLSDRFAGVLFKAGGLLDANEYFIILPDAIGHGGSSKPSDGLRGEFPAYTYDDMVRAQHLLLTEHLGVDHLRLVTGTSMGGMFSWVWGYSYPGFMDAIMPLASLPVEIAGRNRMLRKMIIDAVKNDPDWNGGAYEKQPTGLREALYPLIVMTSSPLQFQAVAPTREAAEELLEARVSRYGDLMDANDMVWAFDSSRFYDPQPHLEKITAPLLAINSADDQVNPPELRILEAETGRAPLGEAVVLPITSLTRGHGTHSLPSIWGPYLARLLARSGTDAPKPDPLLLEPDASAWTETAPADFRARFRTTEGSFEVTVHRSWAPLGADRFFNLVRHGFYDGVTINRVVEGYIAQFGLSPNPRVTTAWKEAAIRDDPVEASNTRGRIAFATTGPDTRNTQVYINLVDNTRLDSGGFAPFGEISAGMDVVERLYALHGENAGGGMRAGRQGPIEEGGRAYLEATYPLLDVILEAGIVADEALPAN